MSESEQAGAAADHDDHLEADAGGAAEGGDGDGTPHHVPKPRRDWFEIETAYVRGTDVDGALVFPTFEEIAKKFAVSKRQVCYHSVRKGWQKKREQYKADFALESHRRKIGKLLKEMDAFDGRSLMVAKVIMGEVIQTFHDMQVTRAAGQQRVMSPGTLETLARAAAHAQKIGRLAMNLPTELLQAADEAERKRQEQARAAGTDLAGVMAMFVEKINGLEGEQFLEAVSSILGAPPGGPVIDVPVVPIRMLPPARPPGG